MNPGNRVRLQNRLLEFLNAKASLGCKVHAGVISGGARLRKRGHQYLSRLIMGTAKDGRTIALYPILDRRDSVPLVVCEFLREIETRCGIVGTPLSIGDAFTIVIEDPVEYPRRAHTKLHIYWLEKNEKKKFSEEPK